MSLSRLWQDDSPAVTFIPICAFCVRSCVLAGAAIEVGYHPGYRKYWARYKPIGASSLQVNWALTGVDALRMLRYSVLARHGQQRECADEDQSTD